jgi:hypothetical protein
MMVNDQRDPETTASSLRSLAQLDYLMPLSRPFRGLRRACIGLIGLFVGQLCQRQDLHLSVDRSSGMRAVKELLFAEADRSDPLG